LPLFLHAGFHGDNQLAETLERVVWDGFGPCLNTAQPQTMGITTGVGIQTRQNVRHGYGMD
jgi:hypothetical protein